MERKERLIRSDQIMRRLDEALCEADWQTFEHDGSIRYLDNPAELLMKIFGITGEPRLLYQEEERDLPTRVTYEVLGEAIRLTVFHTFDRACIKIIYDKATGKVYQMSRQGDVYPANISGSRWYGLDADEFLEYPGVKKFFKPEQVRSLTGDRARLIEYHFFPGEEGLHHEYGEGSARIIYYWDKRSDDWIYVAHSERPVGTGRDEVDFYEARADDV